MSEKKAKKFEVQLGSRIKAGDKKRSPTPAPPAGGVPDAMTLEQIAAVSPDRRRQLNVSVPEDLWLHRRTALYREDHGLGATRQNIVALAVDEWLRTRGY